MGDAVVSAVELVDEIADIVVTASSTVVTDKLDDMGNSWLVGEVDSSTTSLNTV